MRLRATIALVFLRRIWLVATLLLAWVMPARLYPSAQPFPESVIQPGETVSDAA